ncbi:MAG: 4'-phosphopantetheinyl transferase superfamily protein [Thermoanaerobaculia bacterium]|nr:4'-phosphopantetheinyl transferase superfamily protein [Thermoanaerobaculia bacterium]
MTGAAGPAPASSTAIDSNALLWLSQGMGDLPADDCHLTPREAARLAGMRFEKRRSEFRLGRFTAKRALALALGRDAAPAALAAFEIGSAADGAPEPRLDGAPAPRAISMSDRAGQAVCLVGPAGLALGIDLELVEPRSQAFVADFLTEAEQARVAAAGEGEGRALAANLIWSAKEAALKVLRTGLRRSTRSVEVELLGGLDGREWSPLSVHLREGGELAGWWRRCGAFVLTVAAGGPIPPPRALVEPPGLAAAVPSAAWCERTGVALRSRVGAGTPSGAGSGTMAPSSGTNPARRSKR